MNKPFAQRAFDIFAQATAAYHQADNVDAPEQNPFEPGSIEHTLFAKNHVDAVQWHLEDIIRDPDIDPVAALALKRRIDRSNQVRTDMVEELDTYFRTLYAGVAAAPDATINTESPAWALDRLSILALKIYHMRAEAERTDASAEHRTLRRQARRARGTACRPHLCHRHPARRHRRRPQVHEGVPPDEDVQRRRHQPGALRR